MRKENQNEIYPQKSTEDRQVPVAKKQNIERAVKKVVSEYGTTLKLLANE